MHPLTADDPPGADNPPGADDRPGADNAARTSAEPGPGPETSRSALGGALAADVAVVLVFAGVGRRSHAETGAALGVLETAGPFLAGTAAAWALPRVRRQATAPVTGLLVAGTTVAVGMLGRRLVGEGTAGSFVLVATGFLTATAVGWRALARAARRSRRR